MVIEGSCAGQETKERVGLEWMLLEESCFCIEVYRMRIVAERGSSFFWSNGHHYRRRRHRSWKVDWWHHGMKSHNAIVGKCSKCVGCSLCKMYVNMAVM